jgi:hypothetical protein
MTHVPTIEDNIKRKVFYPWNDIQRWKDEHKNIIKILAEVQSSYKFDNSQKQITIFYRYK